MSFMVSTLHIALVRGSTPHRLRVRASGFLPFRLIFDQNLPSFENGVLVRIELRGAIVELARKTKMAQGLCLVINVHAHKATKLAFAHAHNLGLRNPWAA